MPKDYTKEIKLSDIVRSPEKRMNVFGVENWEGMNLGYSGNVKRLTRAEVILGSWDRLRWNESLVWWHMPVTLAFGILRKEDQEFKAPASAI